MQKIGGAVRRAVVDDDDLVLARRRVLSQGVHAFAGILDLIEHGNDDGDRRKQASIRMQPFAGGSGNGMVEQQCRVGVAREALPD